MFRDDFPQKIGRSGPRLLPNRWNKKLLFFSKDPSQEREHHLSLGAKFFQSTPKFWGEPIHSPWKIRQWPVPEINITLKQVVISRGQKKHLSDASIPTQRNIFLANPVRRGGEVSDCRSNSITTLISQKLKGTPQCHPPQEIKPYWGVVNHHCRPYFLQGGALGGLGPLDSHDILGGSSHLVSGYMVYKPWMAIWKGNNPS